MDEKRTGLEVAVIGMAGKFPGAANIDEFWENLKQGKESITFFSNEELLDAGVDPALLKNPNYVKARGIIEDVEYFDASFFEYSPGEAELLNPLFRIYLECGWEALENAGYDPLNYTGSIGNYVGTSSSLFWEGLSIITGKSNNFGQLASGSLTNKDFLSTTISYKLNLTGPSVIVQTACSTSLVSIHLACRAVLSGECTIALAGGISISFPRVGGYLYQEGMVISPDGHCRSFDEKARGTVGGEGVGVVVLKRLKKAITDKDNIIAVVKGSAINNDGKRKVGYAAPSITAQAEVIRMVLEISRVSPDSISYIETHGTGTVLGDPIEIEGLKNAFGSTRTGFCPIGSVKTNVGHLDAAAGVAGFIKTVLALKYRLIPPSLHYENPNPKINFKDTPFYVNVSLTPWKNDLHPLRAGVSSFGIGGTNAHIILEEWSKKTPHLLKTESSNNTPYLLLLSAKTQTALEKATQNLVEFLKIKTDVNLEDIAYTMQVGRHHFLNRRMLVCTNVEDAVHALSNLSNQVRSFVSTQDKRPIIFMFPGLGSQYINMGWGLYANNPIFKEHMNNCFNTIKLFHGFDIKELLYPSEKPSDIDYSPGESIDDFQISQLVIFCIEYALAKLLIHWGINPDAMIGYSFGEYSSACIAGVLSLQDILKLIIFRGQLIHRIAKGLMLSVPLSKEQLAPYLNEDNNLSLAIDNGYSCIIAGSIEPVTTFEKRMKAERILCIPVPNSYAIHSSMMDPILRELETFLSTLKFNYPKIPYISNVTGNWICSDEVVTPRYWVNHLRNTVKFAEGINRLIEKKNAIFVEVGPGRDLTTLLGRFITNPSNIKTITTMRNPGKIVPDIAYLVDKIGHIWLYGVHIHWEKFNSDTNRFRTPLPTYPFEKKKYWIEGNPFKIGAKALEEKSLNEKKTSLSEWFYYPTWRQARKIFENKAIPDWSKKKCWLIFSDECGLGRRLSIFLENFGQQVINVKIGKKFQKINEYEFTINPLAGHDDDYNLLFGELIRMELIPGKIIHFWNITLKDIRDVDIVEVERAQDTGFHSLIDISRAIGKQGIKKQIHLFVISNNMQDVVGNDGRNPQKTTLLGPVKVIPKEFSNLRCSSIDLFIEEQEFFKDNLLIEQLSNAFFHESIDQVTALRCGIWWEQTVEPFQVKTLDGTPKLLKHNGVYMIIGGLGGIGFALAEHLALTTQARLVLTSRSILPPQEKWDEWVALHEKEGNDNITHKILKLKKLESMGIDVLVCCADISNQEQMNDVITQTIDRFGELNGVIHSAGLPDGAIIQRRNRDVSNNVLESKIKGTVVLYQLLKKYHLNINLDFLIFCSSLSSIVPALGQAAYCAANTFLDAMSHWHLSNFDKFFTMSIDWDRWINIGIAKDAEELHRRLSGEDLKGGMTLSEAVDVFSHILADPTVQVAISTVDLKTFIKKSNTYQSGDIMEAVENKLIITTMYSRPELNNPYVEPKSEVEKALTDLWQSLFKIEPIGIVDDFFELGGDSLKALILISKINKILHVEIPVEEFFKNPTIEKLAVYVNQKGIKRLHEVIDAVEEREYYPLFSAQMRLYILQQMDPSNISYNQPNVLLLEGELDRIRMEEAIFHLINRHESLRTSFQIVNETPVQRIHKKFEFKIEYFPDIKDPKLIILNFIKPFNMMEAPLLRIGLAKLGESNHILLIDMHHIISDALSVEIFVKDFSAFYAEQLLPPLNLQYKDFSQWKNSTFQKISLEKQKQYWLKEIGNDIPILDLPTNFPRPLAQRYEGGTVSFAINKAETESLKIIAREEDATLFMVLISIFYLLLAKVSGQDDLIVGIVTAGRNHVDLQHITGMFVNTLPLRAFLSKEKKFRDFLTEVKEKTLIALENQDYQFEDIVDEVVKNRDMTRNPLFDVMFEFQGLAFNTGELSKIQLPGLKMKPYEFKPSASKFDITLTCLESGESIITHIKYSAKLFKENTINWLATYFKEIGTSIVKNPDQLLLDILKDASERRKKFLDHLQTTLSEEITFIEKGNKIFQEKLQKSMEKFKDNLAVEYGNLFLTYSEVDKRSNCIANWLYSRGIKKESIIGILMSNRVDFITAVIGILKAGCIFVPLDDSLPKERLEFMIQYTSVTNVLCDKSNFVNFAGLKKIESELIIMEGILLNSEPSWFLRVPDASFSPGDKIYIYFTSGTTGTPKAIVGKNKSLLHFIEWEIETFGIDETFRVSQFTSFGFDAFLRDIFVPLCSGGVSCIPKKRDILLDPHTLIDWIDVSRINLIHCVPSLFRLIVSGSQAADYFKMLKYILLSGERINPMYISNWYSIFGKRIQLVNFYGPTETTMIKTHYFINPEDTLLERIPIGKPMKGSRLLILDEQKQLCDILIKGRIFIQTPYRTFGYYNEPGLNTHRFIPTLYSEYNGDLLYDTGDIGMYLPDGNIELLGREDRQVKLYGIRIELEEIENTLNRHPLLKEVVVIKQEIASGNEILCAYVTVKEEKEVNTDSIIHDIRKYLTLRLPDYMIPSNIILVDRIPRNPNGKVDFASLVKLFYREDTEYIPPQSDVEKKLQKAWSSLLGIDRIGINENFFQLGGNSFRLVSLISHINNEFETNISIKNIFDNSTIKMQAEMIARSCKNKSISIEKVEKREYYPLSSAQMRLYILQQMDPKSTAYNVFRIIMIEEELEREKIENIFRRLIFRHESLRTSFKFVDSGIVQTIHENIRFHLQYWEGEKEEYLIRNFIQPFDLSIPPLVRAGLIKLAKNRFILMIDLHHIISDGTSHAILVKDFESLIPGKPLNALPFQYKEYAVWQQRPEIIAAIRNQEQFWLHEFDGEIPLLNLPLDYPRPSVRNVDGNSFDFELTEEDLLKLNKIAHETGITLFMLLLSVYHVFLSKLSGQEDIVVGIPTAGRTQIELEQVIGMFVNTLALRNISNPKATFIEFLFQVKEKVLEAFENQQYPFEELVEKVVIERDMSRNPVFDVMFAFQDITAAPFVKKNDDSYPTSFKTKPYSHTQHTSRFDLTLSTFEKTSKLLFSFEYCTRIFKKETIERYAKYFINVINSVIEKTDKKICHIEIITEAEKKQILFNFNDTYTPFPGDKTIHRLFELQANKHPNCTSIVQGELHITYSHLDSMSDHLAETLIKTGLTAETIVAISLENSLETVVGILGVLKAGGAYLPIDPGYPQERCEFMINDSGAKILITDKNSTHMDQKKLRWECKNDMEIICIDTVSTTTQSKNFPTTLLPGPSTNKKSQAANMAYVIYTSGSTGKPKAVMVEHKGIINLITYHKEYFGICEKDRVAQFAPFTFDASMWEVSMALLNGATLCPVDKDVKGNYRLFEEFLNRFHITVATLPPIFAVKLIPGECKQLRLLVTAGSSPIPGLVKHWKETCVYINAYGPTEVTICASAWRANENWTETDAIPIGTPLFNTQIYILDAYLKLQPIGVPGELCVAGVGIARGYLNRPELTAEKFIIHPMPLAESVSKKKWKESSSSLSLHTNTTTLYKTGDLSRWLSDGNIEFLGRIDHQIKVRGFRIELGEIEKNLLAHPDIEDVIVVAYGDNIKDHYLCAYIMSRRELLSTELRNFLLKSLPDFMIPSYFIPMEKIPLTINGKVDRKALPKPHISTGEGSISPRTEIEKKLVDIWSEALGVEKNSIGIHSNFFQLGGHSLKAIEVIARIYKELNVKIPLTKLFENPYIADLSRIVGESREDRYAAIQLVEDRDYYPLSSAQKRLYMAQLMETDSIIYNMPIVYLVGESIEIPRIEETLLNLIRRHEALRTSFEVIGNEPVQIIHPPHEVHFSIEHFSLTGLDSKKEREENVKKILRDFIRPFDLSTKPLLRVGMITSNNEPNHRLLVIDIHHIITDAISQNILTWEFSALYAGDELTPLKLQYKDFALWQNLKNAREAIKSQEKYWLNMFRDGIPQLNIPTDFPRPPLLQFDANQVSFTLDTKETAELKQIALDEDVTIFMLLLSIYYVLLSKLSNQDDILVGTVTSGRNHPDLKSILGFFVNYIVLRNFPYREKLFIDFLGEVKERTLEAFENSDYPFEDLVDTVVVKKELNRHPICDIGFTFENVSPGLSDVNSKQKTDLKLIPQFSENQKTKQDIILQGTEVNGKIFLIFKYCTRLFKEETIKYFIDGFKKIVSHVVEEKNKKLKDIEIFPGLELEEIRSEIKKARDSIQVEFDI